MSSDVDRGVRCDRPEWLNGQQAAPTKMGGDGTVGFGGTHQQQHSLGNHYQRCQAAAQDRTKNEFSEITRWNLDGHAAGEDDGIFSQVENITPSARDLRMVSGRRSSTSPVRTNTYSSVPVQIERDTVAPSPTFGMRAFDATLVNLNTPLHQATGHSTYMKLLLSERVKSSFATSYGSIRNVARRPAQQPRPRQANHQRSAFRFNGEAGISAYNRGTPTTYLVESPSRFAATSATASSLLPQPPDNLSRKSVVAPSEPTMNDDRHLTPDIAAHISSRVTATATAWVQRWDLRGRQRSCYNRQKFVLGDYIYYRCYKLSAGTSIPPRRAHPAPVQRLLSPRSPALPPSGLRAMSGYSTSEPIASR